MSSWELDRLELLVEAYSSGRAVGAPERYGTELRFGGEVVRTRGLRVEGVVEIRARHGGIGGREWRWRGAGRVRWMGADWKRSNGGVGES